MHFHSLQFSPRKTCFPWIWCKNHSTLLHFSVTSSHSICSCKTNPDDDAREKPDTCRAYVISRECGCESKRLLVFVEADDDKTTLSRRGAIQNSVVCVGDAIMSIVGGISVWGIKNSAANGVQELLLTICQVDLLLNNFPFLLLQCMAACH